MKYTIPLLLSLMFLTSCSLVTIQVGPEKLTPELRKIIKDKLNKDLNEM